MRFYVTNALKLLRISTFFFVGCGPSSANYTPTTTAPNAKNVLYFGVDLSSYEYTKGCHNFKDASGTTIDNMYSFFANQGSSFARFRLFVEPQPPSQGSLDLRSSNLENVLEQFKKADPYMKTILDFHYSDTWADFHSQLIPAAWEGLAQDPSRLSAQVYQYTYDTLQKFEDAGVLPEIVQVGNETDIEILNLPSAHPTRNNVDWRRNAALLNAGIRAVRDFSIKSAHPMKVLIHISGLESTIDILKEGKKYGLTDYDIIGVSYYDFWSPVKSLGDYTALLAKVKKYFNKEILVVETSFPWTKQPSDASTSLSVNTSPKTIYAFTPQGQKQFLQALVTAVQKGGGAGIVYWEPTAMSCRQKSLVWEMENLSLFDYQGAVLPAIEVFKQ